MYSNAEKNDVIIFATASYDHDIKFWEAHTGVCERTVQHPESQVNAMAITPDSKSLAVAGHQHIRFYEINSSDAKPSGTIEGSSKIVTSIGYQEDGKWMYGGAEDGSIKIWDCRDLRARNYTEARCLQLDAPCNSAILHPNQAEIYIADQNGYIHIWDLVKGDLAPRMHWCPEPNASIQHLAIDPKGLYLAAINNKGRVYVWIIKTKSSDISTSLTPIHCIDAHEKYGLKVRFSEDSNLMLTTSADSSTKVWNVQNRFSLYTVLQDQTHRWIWDAVFTNDCQHIIAGSSDGIARLWSITSGKIVCEFSGHRKSITAIAFQDKMKSS